MGLAGIVALAGIVFLAGTVERNAAVDDVELVPVGKVGEDHGLAAAEVADAGDKFGLLNFFINAPAVGLEENVGAVEGEAVGAAAEGSGKHGDGAARGADVVVEVGDAAPLEVAGEDAALAEVEELVEQAFEAGLAGAFGQGEGAEVAAGALGEELEVVAQEAGQEGEKAEKVGRGEEIGGAIAFLLEGLGDHVAIAGAADGEGKNLSALGSELGDFALDEGVGGAGVFAREVGDGHGGGHGDRHGKCSNGLSPLSGVATGIR